MVAFYASPTVVSESFDDEVILVNLSRGNYYSLRGSAAWLWQTLENGASIEGLAQQLMAQYVVDEPTATQALTTFAAQLQEQELIATTSETPSVLRQVPTLVDRQAFVPPVLEVYTDMADLLALDPIHDVNPASGWPIAK